MRHSTPPAALSHQLDSPLPRWKPATWENYLAYRDNPTPERVRLFFDQGYLFVDMSPEGINHARFRELFTMLFAFWFSRQSEQNFDLLGGCLLEKPNQRAASPDLVLYLGEDSPQHQQGEPRRINLDEWRLPELVGEVGDTTFATDLDEKKQLYAALEIPEYWVVDIRGKRVLAFRLQDDGKYQQCESSVALKGLPIILLEQTLEKLTHQTNGTAALWFAQQIANL